MEAIVSLAITLLVTGIVASVLICAAAWAVARIGPGRSLPAPSPGEKLRAERQLRASLPGVHSIGFLGRWGK